MAASELRHKSPGYTQTGQRVLAVVSSTSHEEDRDGTQDIHWQAGGGGRGIRKGKQGSTVATCLVESYNHGDLTLMHDQGWKRVQGDGRRICLTIGKTG